MRYLAFITLLAATASAQAAPIAGPMPVSQAAPIAGPVVVEEPSVCPPDSECVSGPDMDMFLQLASDHKCRAETEPEVTADSVVLVIDEEGRVFGSGAGPKPFTIRVKWCNYDLEAKSDVDIQVAQRVDPEWGFRFRLKAAFGYLPLAALQEKDAKEGLDGGLLIEPFFFYSGNLNAYVGIRSFGAGLGLDLTKNLGLYAGYALTFGTWHHTVHGAVSFAIW